MSEKKEQVSLKKTHPFQALAPSDQVAPLTDYRKDGDVNIIEYVEYEVVHKTGDGETDFVIEKKVKEASRINRQAFLNEQSQDVGIMNVLNKVRTTGDVSLLNQTQRSPIPLSSDVDSLGRPMEEINDISTLPQSHIKAMQMVENGYEAFASLPEELRGHKTLEQFVGLSQESFDAYIKALKDAREIAASEGEK